MATADQVRKYRADKAAGLVPATHCACGAKHRQDSTHYPLCMRCWRKTDEGKAYMALKQRESKSKKD